MLITGGIGLSGPALARRLVALGDWSAALDRGALACLLVGIEPNDDRSRAVCGQFGKQAAGAATGVDRAAPRRHRRIAKYQQV
jgi:hypothetical protein